MITIVDYGRGNIFSIGQALASQDIVFRVSGKPEDVASAEKLILPGVGAYRDAFDGLTSRGLVEPLKNAAANGVPLLGICVGCQLLLSRGEEFGGSEGLDIIPGVVSRIPDPDPEDPARVRVPNVGWRHIAVRPDVPVLSDMQEGEAMYFVHSYSPRPSNDENVAATCRINGADIPVAVHSGSVLGVQFHPERSGPAGLRLIAGFARARL